MSTVRGELSSLNDGEPRAAEPDGTGRAHGPVSVPTKDSLRWPLILALRELGGSANMNDIVARVSDHLSLTKEQTTVEIPSGASTRLRNRVGWAGFELKQQGILSYPSRNQRELTELGRSVTEGEVENLFRREAPNAPSTATGGTGANGEADLAGLAEELLVDVGFLEDIVELLKDKGQVILYGPPGTGKTYLARALAEALAPEDSCRALVQFHPSTSYEDFFEGYRPVGAGDGSIGYELTPGPLARMAALASEASGERHVMVIDEINRGNLPRVLGELLFLLEYRGESIYPLYRPDTPFSLPENLWFIGTMNTADRSIALVDAALRRRFHFVPFFPDSGPIGGLLDRWLARENQPAWVGKLVDSVNDELKDDLAGSHLLLGPSHFMKRYGSTPAEQQERLRRIWEYNIEPFIEDQFFGDPDRIQHYRFADVYARHGPATGPEGAAHADGDATSDTPASSSSDDTTEHTAGTVGAF